MLWDATFVTDLSSTREEIFVLLIFVLSRRASGNLSSTALVQVVLGIHEGWTLPLQIVTVAIKHLHTRILPINYEHPARGPQRDAVR